jgi:hypothetical protein
MQIFLATDPDWRCLSTRFSAGFRREERGTGNLNLHDLQLAIIVFLPASAKGFNASGFTL